MAATLAEQTARERQAGLVLILAAALALGAANSPLHHAYEELLHLKLGPVLPRVGPLTVHAFVADGLMAIFFLLVGMEVKREWFEGRLSTPDMRRLPVIAAIAGMALPALVYLAVTGFDPALARGWAIPAATDIAFAVAVLAILGRHAPPAVKLLLVSIAVMDDVGAVAIIAIAYTETLNLAALGMAALTMAGMWAANRLGVRRAWPYLMGFALLWILVLASGVHATIAGVAAAMTIPLGEGEKESTLEHLEHRIHPWAMFGIVPLFGFVSAGVALSGGLGSILEPLPLAVALGLLLGKQVGVFAAIRLGSAAGLCCRPEGASWPQIYGASLLCGIGFTMSLFIGALAFPDQPEQVDAAKIGIFTGSLLSALLGWLVLRLSSPVPFFAHEAEAAERIFGRAHQHRRSAASNGREHFASGTLLRGDAYRRDPEQAPGTRGTT